MDNMSPEASADFARWAKELHGPEVVGTAPAIQAYRRAVMARDANGVPTYKNPIYVPVDKYGLPVLAIGAEPTEQEQLELRWDATLLDFPLPEDQTAPAMPTRTQRKYRIAEVLHGNIRQDPIRSQGVQGWKEANFTPEIYALLHALIPETVPGLARVARRKGRMDWLARRLDDFGIIATAAWEITRLELLPSQWRDFPSMLCKVSPQEAVELIIGFGMPAQAEK